KRERLWHGAVHLLDHSVGVANSWVVAGDDDGLRAVACDSDVDRIAEFATASPGLSTGEPIRRNDPKSDAAVASACRDRLRHPGEELSANHLAPHECAEEGGDVVGSRDDANFTGCGQGLGIPEPRGDSLRAHRAVARALEVQRTEDPVGDDAVES